MTVRTPPVPRGAGGEFRCDLAEGERAEVGEQKEDANEEAEVADAVDDEGFLAGGDGGVALEVEADEQIGGETDALPADEHHEDVAGEDQDGHEEEEEVEVAEVARVALFVGHVADGVDVDEEADAGDDEEHDERKLIEDEAEVDVERPMASQGYGQVSTMGREADVGTAPKKPNALPSTTRNEAKRREQRQPW